jgi:WD40 repeat protein
LLSLDDGPVVRLFGAQDASEEDEFRPLAFSPDGRFLAACDPMEWYVRVWDLEEGGEEQELAPDDGVIQQVLSLAFSPTGDLLAACDRDGQLVVWQAEESGVWSVLHAAHREAKALAFSPDGLTLAVGRPGSVEFLNPSLGEQRHGIETGAGRDEDVLFLHYTPTGSHLVLITGSTEPERRHEQHQLRLWDVAKGQQEQCVNVPFGISAVAASADGRFLAWVVHDEQHSPGEITFWDVERWQEAGRLEWDPEDSLRDLAFSADGQTLVTGSEAGVVKLWPWRLLLEV